MYVLHSGGIIEFNGGLLIYILLLRATYLIDNKANLFYNIS
jgi:hypothetical protein